MLALARCHTDEKRLYDRMHRDYWNCTPEADVPMEIDIWQGKPLDDTQRAPPIPPLQYTSQKLSEPGTSIQKYFPPEAQRTTYSSARTNNEQNGIDGVNDGEQSKRKALRAESCIEDIGSTSNDNRSFGLHEYKHSFSAWLDDALSPITPAVGSHNKSPRKPPHPTSHRPHNYRHVNKNKIRKERSRSPRTGRPMYRGDRWGSSGLRGSNYGRSDHWNAARLARFNRDRSSPSDPGPLQPARSGRLGHWHPDRLARFNRERE